MTVQAIAVRGPFTDDDLKEITALIRRIDERNPTAVHEIYAIDPNESLFAAKRLMAEILPSESGRQTTIPDDAAAAYSLGRRAGLTEAAEILDLSPSALRLAAGEMTAQEMRTVRAVLRWRMHEIQQRGRNGHQSAESDPAP